MDIMTKRAIYGYFTSLEVQEYFYIYSPEQRIEIVNKLDLLLELNAMSKIEHTNILLWLDAIRMGDLGDWCSSYYYNVNERRLFNLRSILGIVIQSVAVEAA